MKPQTASRIVLLSALGVFGMGWFKSAKAGKPVPPPRFLIGATVTFGLLSVLSDFEPEIAGPLALAILTTDFFAEGPQLLGFLNEEGAEPVKQGAKVTHPQGEVGQVPGAKTVRHPPRTRRHVVHPRADVGQVPGLAPIGQLTP